MNAMDALFRPRSVAVIGATEREGSVGRTVFSNLLATPFGGVVYPVNPKRRGILGVATVPAVAKLPEKVDLAVIVTPAESAPGLIEECGKCGIPAAIIISAGFKELGPEGARLEAQILEHQQRYGIRIIGPNCLGVMNPVSGLNATFAGAMARRGKVAFLSQSGALCTAILDWSLQSNVGFSAFVSVGSMLDVGWGDLIDYFGNDPETDSILLYMETVGDARSFLSAAREIALNKPIIAIKGGRTREASQAAASHTGSLAGSDDAFDAALHRVGVLRVEWISDLFSMAAVLSMQPRPKGRRLTIITNAGGPGVLATDSLVRGGGQLTPLSPETRTQLDAFLPPHWSRNNPIDVLGDADAQRYAKTLEIVAADPNSDGLLVILTPQDMTDPLGTAEALRPLSRLASKPVLTSWMGGGTVEQAIEVLNAASFPTFPYPDTAARAFNYLWRFSDNLRNIYETPAQLTDDDHDVAVRREAARTLLESIRSSGRTLLTEVEAKQLLRLYEIPVVPTEIARSAEEAVALADRFGYPAVVKLYSHAITHKTDVGGVKLHLRSAADVAAAYRDIEAALAARGESQHFQGVAVQPMVSLRGDAYELLVGSLLDPQFGPVLMFGSGGQLVEVLRDSAVALPPLNATLARRLIERTRIFKALQGVRGRRPVDLVQLERTLIAFSILLMEQPLVRECDINPLVASPDGVLALDARVVLQPAGVDVQSLPRPAIRPYPSEYMRRAQLRSGAPVLLRPIRLEDEPQMVQFHQALSEESVQLRFFHAISLSSRVAHERLVKVCYSDYEREIALVAEDDSPGATGTILGVGRVSRARGAKTAEFAILVADQWQGKGVGRLLLEQLVSVARKEGVERLVGHVLPQNQRMLDLCRESGFELTEIAEEDEILATLAIPPAPPG